MFVWKRDAGNVVGYNCYLGPAKVGHVYYDGTVARDNPSKYQALTYLPGQDKGVRFTKPEEAKAYVEELVAFWFRQIPPKFLRNIVEGK